MCDQVCLLAQDDIDKAIAAGVTHGYLASMGDMKAFGWIVTADDADEDWGDETCLCGVDVEAILERNGVIWGVDVFGYNVFKSVEEKEAYGDGW